MPLQRKEKGVWVTEQRFPWFTDFFNCERLCEEEKQEVH